MDAARAAVSQFTKKSGHTTEVDENIRPIVTEETVIPTRHVEQHTAIDREVHQQHYHTTVQPIEDRQVLPEKHVTQTRPVEEKVFSHGDDAETRMRLEREQQKFRDTTTTQATRETSSQGQAVMGEHVHHHVHEIVQPILNKETIAPEVVHTIQPIHEKHEATAQVHGTSVLPTKSLSEFQSMGGGDIMSGRKGTKVETYEGVPRQYNQDMMPEPTEADLKPGNTGVDGPGSHHTGGTGLAPTDTFTDSNESHRVTREANSSTGLGHQHTKDYGTGQQEREYNTNTTSSTDHTRASGTDGLTSSTNYNNSSSLDNTRASGTDGLPSSTHHKESAAARYQEEKGGIDTSRSHDATDGATGKKPSLMDKVKNMME